MSPFIYFIYKPCSNVLEKEISRYFDCMPKNMPNTRYDKKRKLQISVNQLMSSSQLLLKLPSPIYHKLSYPPETQPSLYGHLRDEFSGILLKSGQHLGHDTKHPLRR